MEVSAAWKAAEMMNSTVHTMALCQGVKGLSGAGPDQPTLQPLMMVHYHHHHLGY